MERLTKRNNKGITELNIRCPEGCEYVTCSPEEGYQCQHQCEGDIITKLAVYEDAAEQGLLVKLPCKPGDTIYYVADGKITEKHVIGFLYTNQLYIVTEEFNFNCPAALIGHALFITREEAEAKLKEMEGSHDGE